MFAGRYLIAAGLLATFQAAAQPSPPPQTIDLGERADTLAEVAARAKGTIAISPQRKVVVDGEVPMTSMILTARELVFKPGGKLVIADSDQSSSNYFIVADRIVVEDPEKPGVITWGRTALPPAPPSGQAGSGTAGSGAGVNGQPGTNGPTGVTGTAGQRAPSLTVFVRTIVNGGLVVDMRGNQGGQGGPGQQGGNGGAGAQGSHASQDYQSLPFGGKAWLPSCASGPGMGGGGGNGGRGGDGGTGGVGGAAGSVTLISLPEHLPTLFQAIRVNVGGGEAGKGGVPGQGGSGGAGGPEGPLANFCNSAGRNGAPGASGPVGGAGQPGSVGKAGQPFVANLANDQFSSLFGF